MPDIGSIDAHSGGYRVYRNLDLDENGVAAKASPCRVRGYYIYNAAAAARFIKIYDKATAPTSSDTPLYTIPIPAGAAANREVDWRLLTGFGLRATTAVADNDTGAPATNDVVVNFDIQ